LGIEAQGLFLVVHIHAGQLDLHWYSLLFLLLTLWRRVFITLRSLVHPFEQIFEVVESVLPKPRHLACPVDQRSKRAELRAVVRLTALVAVADQSGLLEDAEMFRDSWLRDPCPSCQCRNGLLAFAAQSLEYGAPRGIGEGPEKRIVRARHGRSITG